MITSGDEVTIDDKFGRSVSISKNNYIAIGVYKDRGNNGGCMYLYQINGSNINKIKRFSPTNNTNNNNFGYSVAINNDYIIIGNTRSDLFSGNVSVYKYMLLTNI